jgi:hypothetical protein
MLLVAPGAAHVFGRAGPCLLDADRIPLAPLRPQAALERNLVPPAMPLFGRMSLSFVVVESSYSNSSKFSCISRGSP